MRNTLSKLMFCIAVNVVLSAPILAQGEMPRPFTAIQEPAGQYRTSWIGNSFSGGGGENGFGYWVQNGADEIEVTPDGTVFAGGEWDEAGRCLGLYKDGQVNRVLVKASGKGIPSSLADSAWGWGSATRAFGVAGDMIYVANTGKQFLRFRWTPGDIESVRCLDAHQMGSEAVGLAAYRGATGDLVAIAYKDAIELRSGDFTLIARAEIAGIRDLAFSPEGVLWVLKGKQAQKLGVPTLAVNREADVGDAPVAISFAPDGKLIVCDNGPRQQVLFFDVAGQTVREVAAFGDAGGIMSGTPGEVASHKLFALTGAGVDSKGRLYVSMGFNGTPAGGFFLRAFEPNGPLKWDKLLWQLENGSFVDTFGFDPTTDGTTIYSRYARYDLDLTQQTAGAEAKLKAITLDPMSSPTDDPRQNSGSSVFIRELDGRKAMFTTDQWANGYRIYAFDKPDGLIAKPVNSIDRGTINRWAWDVADNGDIWLGDAADNQIQLWSFKGWDGDTPRYDWEHPQKWPWPAGWQVIRRVIYEADTDSLFVCGYLEGQRIETWGSCGPAIRRYDGWLHGERTLVWGIDELPRDGNQNAEEGPLAPQSMDVAGDYIFFGMSRPVNGAQYVHILRRSDGSYTGTFRPGPEVEGHAGWLDMPFAIQAFKRRNGEYLVLVEEDWRGKNLLYRWTPPRL